MCILILKINFNKLTNRPIFILFHKLSIDHVFNYNLVYYVPNNDENLILIF